MRERCSCGANIRASRKDVLTWRTEHRHEIVEQEPEQQGTTSQVEHAGTRYYESEGPVDVPIVQARTGFAPNA